MEPGGTPRGDGALTVPPGLSTEEFAGFRDLIHRTTGIALAPVKIHLVASRLAPRLRALGLTSFGDYYALLMGADPQRRELHHMINAVTTNKTAFYREPHHFALLGDWLRAARPGHEFRVWSAACSTGEEPWSLAMTAADIGHERVRILASDIDTNVLRAARDGVYDEDRVSPLSEAQRRAHLLRGTGIHAGSYKVKESLRRLVDFTRINLVDGTWPHTQPFDVIFCRNVIIYFDRARQQQLFEQFARHLVPGGYLVLGHSENLLGLSDRFESAGPTAYRLRDAAATPQPAARSARPHAPGRAHATPKDVARVNLIIGGVHASRTPLVIRTVLGSCVAACLFDPVARVGGMNHFLLPGEAGDASASTRYGVHAMEMLINSIMALGGDRRRLEAKVFGGASVLALSSGDLISARNASFVREFLEVEGIPLRAHRLGGTQPLEVLFETHTGRALIRPVRKQESATLITVEKRFSHEISATVGAMAPDRVILFDESRLPDGGGDHAGSD